MDNIVTNVVDISYERAVRDYARTGDEAALWEALERLGYDYGECYWHSTHRG